MKNILKIDTVTRALLKNPFNRVFHLNPKAVLRHLYLTSCSEDYYQANNSFFCLYYTYLGKVVKYHPLFPINEKLFHQFPTHQVVDPTLVLYALVYLLVGSIKLTSSGKWFSEGTCCFTLTN